MRERRGLERTRACARRRGGGKLSPLSPSLHLPLPLTEHHHRRRPLAPARPKHRQGGHPAQGRPPRQADHNGDGPGRQVEGERLAAAQAAAAAGDGVRPARPRPLYREVDEQRVEKDGDQVVKGGCRDDEGGDAFVHAPPPPLEVKHELNNDGRADGFEDEAQGEGQHPGHAEDGVGDGAGDEGFRDAGDEEEAGGGGAGPPKGAPVEFQPRPQENQGERALADLGAPGRGQGPHQPGDGNILEGDARQQLAEQGVEAEEGDQGAAGLI